MNAPSQLTIDDLERLFKNGALWAAIDVRPLFDASSPVAADLATLHNKGRIVLFEAADHEELINQPAHRAYALQQLLVKVVANLDGDADTLMSFVARLEDRLGEKNAYDVGSAMAGWCRTRPAQCGEIVDRAEIMDPLARRFVTAALIGLGDLVRIRALVAGPDSELRDAGLRALAKTPHSDQTQRDASLACLRRVATDAPSDALCALILQAIFASVIGDDPPSVDAIAAVCDCLEKGHARTRQVAAFAFLTKPPAAMPLAFLEPLLQHLKAIEQSETAALCSIDGGLGRLVERGLAGLAMGWIHDVVTRDEEPLPIEGFEGSLGEITRNTDALSAIVLDWLHCAEPVTCLHLGEMLRAHSVAETPLTIDLGKTPYSPIELYFICRRATGFLLTEEIIPASLIVAVARIVPEGDPVRRGLGELLVNPLLLNYGGALVGYLKALPHDDAAHDIITEALDLVEAYRSDLDVPPVAELGASEDHRQIARNHRDDEMREATKIGRKTSIFYDMVTHQHILHGTHTSTVMIRRDGSRHWSDSQMTSRSYSYEIPRQDVLDPVGLNMRVFKLRTGTLRS